MDKFRVRLNCIDHYQATPTRYDPVLRTNKVCAHIHGAFPYLFVEYEDSLDPDEVGAYIHRLHLSIDHALAVSYRRDAYKEQPKFVARITLVKGVPFYGFHVGYRFYLKIYMFNPMVMTRLADLLQQGLIMNRIFQPYEAHLQYLLQWMTDYNLYGCDYIEAEKAIFRSPVPLHDEVKDCSHRWHGQSIPADRITDDAGLPRVSHCSLEVDICVQHILNREAVQERPLHHDFIERVKPMPSDTKLVYSMAGLWHVLVPMSADPRDSQPQRWLHEEEYRNQIAELIAKEAIDDWWRRKQTNKAGQAPGQASSLQQLPATPGPAPFISQIVGATPKNKHGFRYSQKRKSTSVQHEAQYMSTMSVEVHVNTRGKLFPDPGEDAVQCIFWCVRWDEDAVENSQGSVDGTLAGIIVLSEDGSRAERIRRQTGLEMLEETTELDLMVRLVEVVRTHDPDVLTGYEVHGSSWGYLMERARTKYDFNLCDELSRMKSQSHGRSGKEADRWGFNTTSSIRVTGRHMINVWRAMRGELNLLQYTMENVAWHLLHRRIPHYSWQTLTNWYSNGRHGDLSKLLRYYTTRTRMDIEILEANELIPRTSEQARLLGVDFFSVFSRGSQFKVESIMFRIAKPENLMLVSPSRKQVGGQNALECLPLVMEPQSAFYNSPLVVLDFQSLYPSVMIAYNYCYSTFLGRVANWRGTNKMGFAEYKRQEGLLQLLKDHINIAPNGIMYVRPEMRKSLLAKMLIEILETRVMVKSGMKQDKDDKRLQQLLNNRQLALKLLANVTYGYTSASFSGRMPCSEIADSIVQTGRETLERAIAYIHSVERWGAEVVYGDTDSLFVYLRGRTRAQAFDIGEEMAQAITDRNPRPVKLKFEKVYHPCVLLAKKRYVGYKWESRGQAAPEFDAKGIETVRRDGTPAEQKMEEKALKLLFDTADLSQVKAYFQAQCAKVLQGHVSVQDFCFAREVRLGSYATESGAPAPAGALISTRRMLADARAEPQYGERVPYVVVAGAPGARLVDRCVAPEDLLAGPGRALDAAYYIGKNIMPPLERIFNLVGASVQGWYEEMPKVLRVRRLDAAAAAAAGGSGSGGGGCAVVGAGRGATLEAYMRSASCVGCGVKMTKAAGGGRGDEAAAAAAALCRACTRDAAGSVFRLRARLSGEERRYADTVRVCRSCAGLAPLDEVACDSKDCPVFYTRVKQATRLRSERAAVEPVLRRFEELAW
ncbi:hypothetical protein P8C59_009232 [Phyllachora maydis]|uniref:DNA polymerase n=1 Tax=Phyllachora maydis TaxID=1825666 RepID=A0AAD9MFE5_9PEZI|nr:hypothetical protein P8C59_009232 [Phyllachora maydis]